MLSPVHHLGALLALLSAGAIGAAGAEPCPQTSFNPRVDAGVTIERITTAVPWPRGIAWADGELLVLARGRHRRDGGVAPGFDDAAGTIFGVDPAIAEPLEPGRSAGAAVNGNARPIATPDPRLFSLYDGVTAPPDDDRMDRPYCTLARDPVSGTLFICAFSGIDLTDGGFRKNATDAIYRFDPRNERWHVVERHDASTVDASTRTRVVSNEHYPHHDVAVNPPPHGWLNGADAACVGGAFLYAAGKDNHEVVQYDLTEIRRDPDAPPPASRPVLRVRGASALATHGGFLYVGSRSSSTVTRFALDAGGDVVHPPRAEIVAMFDPWDERTGERADLLDLAFSSTGELFVSCGRAGRVWRVGHPDPADPFDGRRGNSDRRPLIELAGGGHCDSCANLVFDDRDRLYLCTNAADGPDPSRRGAIYRFTFPEARHPGSTFN